MAVLRAPDWAHCIAMLSVQPNIRKKIKNGGILDDSIADFAEGFQNGALINLYNFLIIFFRIKNCINGRTRKFQSQSQMSSNEQFTLSEMAS